MVCPKADGCLVFVLHPFEHFDIQRYNHHNRGSSMKKNLVIFIALMALLALVGCASSKKAVVVVEEAPVVVEAADWWNNPPRDTAEIHYEVGYAKGSTKQTSRDWAKANANQAIAQYVNNAIDSIVTTYANDAGEQATNNMQAMQAFESVSKQHAQAILTGVTYKFQDEADGGVYVLAALPVGPLAEEFKEQVREAFVKNEATEEANKMMYAAIDKYFN